VLKDIAHSLLARCTGRLAGDGAIELLRLEIDTRSSRPQLLAPSPFLNRHPVVVQARWVLPGDTGIDTPRISPLVGSTVPRLRPHLAALSVAADGAAWQLWATWRG
jgi:hypothetical protein